MRYLTKMERSCWRGKQRGGKKGARLALWRFIEQEQRWLLRRRRPFLIPWTANVYVRYAGFAWFSAVPDPNDWSVTDPTTPGQR